MKTYLLFAILLFVRLHAQADDITAKVGNLGQMSFTEARSTVDAAVSQKDQLVSILTDEIQQPNFPSDSKSCAIYLLGELRPTNLKSTQALVQNIGFIGSRKEFELRISRWGKYPAQEALFKIGMPSVELILRSYLPTESDQLRRRLMCEVLQDVLGKDLGAVILKRKVDNELDPIKKANLQAALQELEK